MYENINLKYGRIEHMDSVDDMNNNEYEYLLQQETLNNDIIHRSHGFEGDTPEYQPRGDTEALARYVTRCRRQRVT